MTGARARGDAAGAIRTHLFVIAPNNSGSTLLRNAIATSPAVWSLPREGQHMPGFVGPSTRGTGTRLIWAARPEWIDRFERGPYDWARTRAAWHAQATAARPDAAVFVTSSPPFLLNVAALRSAFPVARFVFLTRNPYAAIEGILRRGERQPLEPGEDIREVAARHVRICLERQRDTIARHGDVGLALRYEDMCADPAGAARALADLVPALAGFAWPAQVAVKGQPPAPLRDANAEQIARLTMADRAVIDRTLERARATLEALGYPGIG